MNEKYELLPLFEEETIKKKVQELGRRITEDHKNQEVLFIGVLKGAFIFLADLVRNVNLPLSVDFIGAASYLGTSSTGEVRINYDLTTDIKGKHVILVEDVVDTGRTLDFLLDVFKLKRPKSLKICALLSKPEAHKMLHKIDYVGFDISREFVVGYGLDVDGRYRELPYIAKVREKK